MAESGAASFTAAVTTSPSPARSPRSPPRGKMHESLRAPLLSATSRIVLIPIMSGYLPKNLKCKIPRASTGQTAWATLNLNVEIGRLGSAGQRGAPDDFLKL